MRFQQEYRIGASLLRVRFGDIKNARTQVIVTSDDSELSMGGGTSAAIKAAAGSSVYEASRALVPVPVGTLVSTHSGNLVQNGVQAIFHAATITNNRERIVADQSAIIRGVTTQALDLLKGMRLSSIAFPALGTGFGNFDANYVAVTMASIICDVLNDSSVPLEVEIWLLLGSKKDLEALDFLAAFTEQTQLSSQAVKSHAIILLHGIRDPQGWRKASGDELQRGSSTLTPIPIGYGFFDIIRFWLPVGFIRKGVAETTWNKMAPLFNNPNIEHVSVIAHSFGTWIIGYLLLSKPVHFHRVFLCGSILDSNFSWSDVSSKVDPANFPGAPSAVVVNDCGIRDIWPIMAKFTTWGFGSSGRIGFQNALVADRFHDIDHSGFFEEGFATDYWVPPLTTSVLPGGDVTEESDISPHYILNLLTIIKLPIVMLLVIAINWVLL